jgi:hypothetical protein
MSGFKPPFSSKLLNAKTPGRSAASRNQRHETTDKEEIPERPAKRKGNGKNMRAKT